jgi:hypothetical protein
MSTANDTATSPLAEWAASLRRRGYVPRAPSESVAAIDRQCVVEADCEACGHAGLEFHPFTLPADSDGRRQRYVVLGACPACGQAAEF